ncbi:MAG TPA: GNAT family N-acetyltransferase [Thermoanaerobaculia bacterium]|nr:GNAT family N-acetyltransferase [Thermoanaerobaculia bacterium]
MDLAPPLNLRPTTDADLPFLFRLYASTREEELAGVDWPQEQKDAFVRQQFEAQHAWYREQYAGASFDVVEVDGEPAGRLYVDRWPREVRIVDISLLAQHRGRGFGSALLAALFAEADAAGKPVSVHVERFNPALRLYGRLGFAFREDKGVYLLLERPVGAAGAG